MKKKVKWVFVGIMSIGLLVGCDEQKEAKIPAYEQKSEVWGTTLTQTEGGHFVYTVENATKEKVVYTFTNGMQVDYTLYKEGKKLYTQSEVASFTQAITELTMAPNEKKSYDIYLEDLQDGHYELEVWFAIGDQQERTKKTITFDVE